MPPHRRSTQLQAAVAAMSIASLPALASASSSSHSKHRHRHLHKEHTHSTDHGADDAHSRHGHYLPSPRGKMGDSAHKVAGELRRKRDDADVPSVTRVVQTVSVVQVVDGSGSVVTLSTANPPAATQAGATADAITALDLSDPAQTLVSGTADVGATGTQGTPTASATTGSLSTLAASFVSGASSAASIAPVSAARNATITSSIPLTTGTSSLSGNSSAVRIFGNITSSSHALHPNHSYTSSSTFSYESSSSYSSSSGYSSSLYSSATGSSSSYGADATGGADGAGGASNGGDATGSGSGPAETGSTTNDGASSTPTSTVVGGVIGGIAGLAILLAVALYLLKWKRKREASSHKLLGEGTDGGAGAVTARGAAPDSPDPGSHDSGAMSEARSFLAPFASALAVPTRQNRALPPSDSAPTSPSDKAGAATRLIDSRAAPAGASAHFSQTTNYGSTNEGSPTTERSFYRVSGRKLPSVLQHGGDGYDDPRGSVMSNQSSYTATTNHASMHRDSRGFFGGFGGPSTTPTSRYAVGSPMRPESGVPVLHSGPAKVVSPVSRQGSFMNDDERPGSSMRNLTPPGRSVVSRDGSRDSRQSASRFVENIS